MPPKKPLPMKRVLVLSGDTFVGQHVVRLFYQSREYSIDITMSKRDDDLVKRVTGEVSSGQHVVELHHDLEEELEHRERRREDGREPTLQEIMEEVSLQQRIESCNKLPQELRRYVNAVVPRHNDSPEAFVERLLENDIIVAVMEDDMYEAECAIKVLLGTHYEVEKTFLLVSSALTWANTLTAERAAVRAQRKKDREDELAAFMEENEDNEDEEIPEELKPPKEEDTEEELVENRVFDEADYGTRVPHPRYQHWKVLEHLVKHANSETLHTYVLYAGLPYGHGEGPLHDLLRAAWHHQELPLYGHGNNVVPVIHVEDLAQIIYRVASSDDVLDERYMFAVDRSLITQKKLIQCVKERLGGNMIRYAPDPAEVVEMVKLQDAQLPPPMTMDQIAEHLRNRGTPGLAYFLSDIRCEPGAVLNYYPEEEWMAIDGFSENIDKVVYQFRKVRELAPQRIVVTGPPLSGKEVVAKVLAFLYHTPYITKEAVIKEFEQYTGELRQKLRELLMRRLQRRRDRAHARRARAVRVEKERLRQERLARIAEGEEEEEEEEDDDDDDDDENGGPRRKKKNSDADGGDGAEEGEEGEEAEENEEGEEGDEEISEFDEEDEPPILYRDNMKEDESVSDISLAFSEDKHTKTVEEMVDERYIMGPEWAAENAGEDDEEEELDEEIDEDEDPYEFDDEDEEELLKAQTRSREAAKAEEEKEVVMIASMRQEYQLCLKALDQKLVNGLLPRPKPEVDEEEESEEERTPPRREKKKGRAKKRRDDDDEEDEGDEEEDEGDEEDGEGEEGEEEDEEEDEEKDSDAGSQKPAPPPPDVIEYLDEAVAFFLRWRLRQPDCQNQGYVLDSFPETVRQACLLFYADTEEEIENRGRRIHPPESVDDIPPPIDVAFPFCEIHNIEEEQRLALERDIKNDTLSFVDAIEEGVLSAVNESLYPDTVIVVNETDETLQALSAILTDAYGLSMEETHELMQNGTLAKSPSAAAREGEKPLDVMAEEAGLESSPLSAAFGDSSFGTFPVPEGGAQRHSEAGAEGGEEGGEEGGSRAILSSRPSARRGSTISFLYPKGEGPPEPALMVAEPTSGRLVDEEQPVSATPSARVKSIHTLEALEADAEGGKMHLSASRRRSVLVSAPNDAAGARIAIKSEIGSPVSTSGSHSTLRGKPFDTTAPGFSTTSSGVMPDLVAQGPGSKLPEVVMQFYTQLNRYRKHHGMSAPATDSLLTWFQSVATTEVIGATPDPILVEGQRGAGMGGGDDDDVEEEEGNAMEPPTTTRFAEVIFLNTPPRDLASLRKEAATLAKRMQEERRNPVSSKGHGLTLEEARVFRENPSQLQAFALDVQGIYLRGTSLYGPPLDDSAARAEAASLRHEEEKLLQLQREEFAAKDAEMREAMEAILHEHRHLCQQKLTDTTIGATEGASMPLETYLMTYVLPSLTPLMTEVVKMRPEDPVTVLADLLFRHQRRTQL